MKILIANTDYDKIVVQCGCIGHCSYLEFLKTDSGDFMLNVLNNNPTRKLKVLDKKLYFTNKEMLKFIEIAKTVSELKLTRFVLESGLSIKFEYSIVSKRKSNLDLIFMTFYTSEKDFLHNKSAFDIILSANMWKLLLKNLNTLVEC